MAEATGAMCALVGAAADGLFRKLNKSSSRTALVPPPPAPLILLPDERAGRVRAGARVGVCCEGAGANTVLNAAAAAAGPPKAIEAALSSAASPTKPPAPDCGSAPSPPIVAILVAADLSTYIGIGVTFSCGKTFEKFVCGYEQ